MTLPATESRRARGRPSAAGRWLVTADACGDPSGFRLLAPCDVDAPGYASDSHCQVVFDGLLQDRTRLPVVRAGRQSERAELAEFVLEGYLRRGERVVQELDGTFALVICDARTRTVLCARDGIGMHPLFWARTPHAVVVSPSIDALVAHPGVSRDLNRPALADHLAQRWPIPDETYYTAIRRVVPGHIVWLDGEGDGWHVRRFWTPTVPNAEEIADPIVWLRRFEATFEDAISRHIQQGPIGIFLSGGLDSVSIAVIASDVARRQGLPVPQALSLAFPYPECDETSVQNAVAARLELPQMVLPFASAAGPQGLFWSAIEMCRSWPVPMTNVWRPAYYRLAEEGRARGCSVVLTGTGGDEWLTVEPSYMADLIKSGDLVEASQFLANVTRSFSKPPLAMARYMLWRAGVLPILQSLGRRVLRATAPGVLRAHRRENFLRNIPEWLAPRRELRTCLEERIELTVDELMREAEPRGRYGFYLRGLPDRFLRANRAMDLEEDFEAGRRLGVRILMPFWDAAVVDCLGRMPPAVLNRGGRSKGLVRQMLERRCPGLGFAHQRKVDAGETFLEIVRTQGPVAWEQLGGAPALADLGVVDGSRVGSLVTVGLESARPREVYRLWEVLNLEAWVRAHC